MKKKTIEIPIYGGTLTMIFANDLSYVEKNYETASLGNFGAVTIKEEDEYKSYVVAFTDSKHLSNIAHEVVHLKNFIFKDCAMAVDLINDEPEAYLSGWLFDQINDFLNKK